MSRKASDPFDSCHGEFDGGFKHVGVVKEAIKSFFNASPPEGCGCGQIVRALYSTSTITRLATVTDTGDLIDVPKTCWNTCHL